MKFCSFTTLGRWALMVAAVIMGAAGVSDAVAQGGLSSRELDDLGVCVLREHMCGVIEGTEPGGRAIWEFIEENGGQKRLSASCLSVGKDCNKIYGIAMEAWGEIGFYRKKKEILRASLDEYTREKQAKAAAAERAIAAAKRAEAEAERARLEKLKKNAQQFTDKRDGKKYFAVKIGDKLWMAQNLNYKPSSGNSWCYDGNNSNCDKYGRLYDWETAKTACPSGWHLATRGEWDDLCETVGGRKETIKSGGRDYIVWRGAGTKLKTASGWYLDGYDCKGLGGGTDDYVFSALPGGWEQVVSDKGFVTGNNGLWWTATEYDNRIAYNRGMAYCGSDVWDDDYNDKRNGMSVRCIQGSSPEELAKAAEEAKIAEKAAKLAAERAKADSLSAVASKSAASGGGRSRESIIRYVENNMHSLLYVYKKRLRTKPELAGKITVRFFIDESGNVIFSTVSESTVYDSELENAVVAWVNGLAFGGINKPGDVTEITYPFKFGK